MSEVKKTFYVWQPAEVWYRATVEAGSAEEAISKAKHPSFDGALFELDMDTMNWVDQPWDAEEK